MTEQAILVTNEDGTCRRDTIYIEMINCMPHLLDNNGNDCGEIGLEFEDAGVILGWGDLDGLAVRLVREDGATIGYARIFCTGPEDAARALGSIKSERKAAAARENGKKGGRPNGARGKK